jgi:hypothetical protein
VETCEGRVKILGRAPGASEIEEQQREMGGIQLDHQVGGDYCGPTVDAKAISRARQGRSRAKGATEGT